jgi:hypothetical protein
MKILTSSFVKCLPSCAELKCQRLDIFNGNHVSLIICYIKYANYNTKTICAYIYLTVFQYFFTLIVWLDSPCMYFPLHSSAAPVACGLLVVMPAHE